MNYYNDKFSKDISYRAKNVTIPGMDWEDIAQELDIALWRGLNKFKGRNKATERTFAGTIMKNRIIDLRKAADRQKRFIDSHHLLFSELELTISGQYYLDSARPIWETE